MDQAIWYFGSTIEADLEKAGRKKQKGEAAIINARKRKLQQYLGGDEKKLYRDPLDLLTEG